MNEKPEQVERAYERVVGYVRDEIWRGHLKRGERLPSERDLAELLGVSRNSVREAMRTLSLMGFISSIHGSGNFVSCDLQKNLSETLNLMLLMGETNSMQVSQLRRGMELESARLAARRASPRQAAKLVDLAQRMRGEVNTDKGFRLDQDFHILLCEASGNRLVQALFNAMISTINDSIGIMYKRIVRDEIQADRLFTSHDDLAAAISRHDERAAEEAIRRHFQVVEDCANPSLE